MAGRRRAKTVQPDAALVRKADGFSEHLRNSGAGYQAYEQFSQHVVMPMVEAVAKLMAPHLRTKGAALALRVDVPEILATSKLWTKEQLKLAFHLYCQLPFGKLHKGNPEIIHLAELIGRTPDAVAMKLVNFASLDPAITSTGRSGLKGASKLDREIWAEFHADWEGLAVECEMLRRGSYAAPLADESDELLVPEDFAGETRKVVTEQRIKQNFFRRAVLSGYGGRCCMSGVSEPRLLIASHIVPWSKDKQNRLNPSNGLCLSAIHDRAFDKGLISVSSDFRILVSRVLQRSKDAFLQTTLCMLEGTEIALPERFRPAPAFLARHRAEIFLGD